jgi:formate dehydrogenase subunit gamma
VSEAQSPAGDSLIGRQRITRHALADRAMHWLIALCVLVLLGTAFLPILGLDFSWVLIHWVTGCLLIALVLVHIVRALIWKDLGSVWIKSQDIKDACAIAAKALRMRVAPIRKSGKYSFAQKFIHLAFAIVVLAALVSGGLMMVKIDTPWWDRNPFWLADQTWAVVYITHGLAALFLITMVMAHVYFALRPEKWSFLRSMIKGWITRAEYERQHDPKRWRINL